MLYQTYEKLLAKGHQEKQIYANLACCLFFLGMYEEADEYAQKGVLFFVSDAKVLLVNCKQDYYFT